MSEYEIGYTPNNLKKLLHDEGKSREWCAQLFKVRINAVHSWCVPLDNKNHRDMPYSKWIELMDFFEKGMILYHIEKSDEDEIFVIVDDEGFPHPYAKFLDRDDADYVLNCMNTNEGLQNTDEGHSLCLSMKSCTGEV